MKTVLFSPCYLNGMDRLGNNRIERNIRYVNYYSLIQDDLGFEKIYLLDNGSSHANVLEFFSKIDTSKIIFNSVENLQDCGPNTYPYCWRAFYFVRDLFELGYEKIIFIDSDGFVLSKRLADFIKNLNSGWTGTWCKQFEFPEASLQIICKDSFNIVKSFTRTSYQKRMGTQLELFVPFTYISEDFNCDRYGEIGKNGAEISNDIDYYGQARPHLELKPFWK